MPADRPYFSCLTCIPQATRLSLLADRRSQAERYPTRAAAPALSSPRRADFEMSLTLKEWPTADWVEVSLCSGEPPASSSLPALRPTNFRLALCVHVVLFLPSAEHRLRSEWLAAYFAYYRQLGVEHFFLYARCGLCGVPCGIATAALRLTRQLIKLLSCHAEFCCSRLTTLSQLGCRQPGAFRRRPRIRLLVDRCVVH